MQICFFFDGESPLDPLEALEAPLEGGLPLDGLLDFLPFPPPLLLGLPRDPFLAWMPSLLAS